MNLRDPLMAFWSLAFSMSQAVLVATGIAILFIVGAIVFDVSIIGSGWAFAALPGKHTSPGRCLWCTVDRSLAARRYRRLDPHFSICHREVLSLGIIPRDSDQ